MTEEQLFAIKEQLEQQNKALFAELETAKINNHRLNNRIQRERMARKEAETIMEQKSRELYNTNLQLANLNINLEDKIQQQIQQLEEHVTSLEKANNDIRQFTYLASHDLKTPLRAIGSLIGFIEQDLEKQDNISDDVQECISLIRTRVNRMHRLLNSILEYADIGKKELPITAVFIEAIFREALNSLNFEQKVTVNIKDNLFVLETSKRRLYEILRHIIENAIKYHHNPKAIVLDVYSEKDENWAKLFIKDNGPGIAKRYHERIFQIFQTLETKDKNKESIGIGLPIVKRIIEEEMKGKLILDSDEGLGTTFIFCFPLKAVLE